MWEIEENDLLRFRCRTGHAFSAQSLLAEQSDALEEALFEEKSMLTQRMAKRMRDRNQILSASRLEARNRRGKTIECQVICTPLTHTDLDIRGVILLMEESESHES